MRLAACSEMFGQRKWEEVCQTIADHGYQGVELAPFAFAPSVRDIDARRRQSIRRTAEASGLAVVGLHWLLFGTEGLHLTHPDASVREATTAYLIELVRFCRDVGGRVLVLGSPRQRNRPPEVDFAAALAHAADTLRRPCQEAARLGAVIAVEPLSSVETNFINTAGEARQLIDAVGEPSLRLHLDAKAMTTEKVPMDELVRQHAGLLEHVHVNDVNLRGPGMGQLDLGPLIGALQAVGYQGYLSVEVFDTSLGPERTLEESRNYLTRLISRANA